MNKDYFIKRLEINIPSVFELYNYDLLPETFLAHDVIQIECYQHGVFHQKAYQHLNGNGCPECGRIKSDNGRALTTDEFIFKSKSKFGNKFDYSKTKYFRQDVELTLTCPIHGDINLTFRHHFRTKHGCPKCDFDIPRAIKKQKVLEKAKKIHQNKYDYSRVNFTNMSDKVEIICPSHGSFWQGLYDHTVRQNGCPKCSIDNGKISFNDFISKSRAIHGNQYEYSDVNYKTTASMITITCKKHGDFIQRAASHLAGSKCKKCCVEENRLSAEDFISNARLVHGNSYDYSKVVYHGNKRPVEIICPSHGSFWQKPNAHISSRCGCRFCMESKGEKAIELFLKKYGINYIREYRIFPHLYRYDFYLPGLNIFIEFNGLQHYKPIDFFGGQEGYLNIKERDTVKKLLVKQNKGSLIIVPYTYSTVESVEKELIQKLKLIYVRWYVINGKPIIFKTLIEVYNYFNIPHSVLVRNLDEEVKKSIKNIGILF